MYFKQLWLGQSWSSFIIHHITMRNAAACNHFTSDYVLICCNKKKTKKMRATDKKGWQCTGCQRDAIVRSVQIWWMYQKSDLCYIRTSISFPLTAIESNVLTAKAAKAAKVAAVLAAVTSHRLATKKRPNGFLLFCRLVCSHKVINRFAMKIEIER